MTLALEEVSSHKNVAPRPDRPGRDISMLCSGYDIVATGFELLRSGLGTVRARGLVPHRVVATLALVALARDIERVVTDSPEVGHAGGFILHRLLPSDDHLSTIVFDCV